MNGTAVISADGRYRYMLKRWWGLPTRDVCFVMLNPSTADANKDDPTLRKCVGFAQRLGFWSLTVVNLFAYRATDPKELDKADDPIGPENDMHVLHAASAADMVVCAWGGSSRQIRKRAAAVCEELAMVCELHALRVSEKTGQPGHPLYLPYDLQPKNFGHLV